MAVGGNLTAAPQCLQGCLQADGPRLLTAVCGERMRNNGHMLEKETFRLGTMKRIFPIAQ